MKQQFSVGDAVRWNGKRYIVDKVYENWVEMHSVETGSRYATTADRIEPEEQRFSVGDTVRGKGRAGTSRARFIIDKVYEKVDIHSVETGTRYTGVHLDQIERVECLNDNHDPGCVCGAKEWLAANPSLKGKCSEESWVEEAQRIVSGDRASAYGKPGSEDSTERIAKAWSAYLEPKLNSPIDARDYCWMMVLLKAIRDSHRNQRDCPVDAHGYLLMMEAREHKEGE